MASSTTPTRPTSGGWTPSGACTRGLTARPSATTRPASGGAATTNTTAGETVTEPLRPALANRPEEQNVDVVRRLQRADHRGVSRQPGARRRRIRRCAAVAAAPRGCEVRQVSHQPPRLPERRRAIRGVCLNGGAPRNPDWYYNLKAHPNVTIEVRTDTIPVQASEASGDERDRLFRMSVERAPQLGEYEKQAGRTIPVVVLTPTGVQAIPGDH